MAKRSELRLSPQWLDKLIFRQFPLGFMEVCRRYFRLEVVDGHHIPERGPAVIAPNHSGFSGLDAFMLADQILRSTGRNPRLMVHKFWFSNALFAGASLRMGYIEANRERALKELQKNRLVAMFPEGERGNFKPTLQRYHLAPFKSGFVHLALSANCPIIPTLIIGSEEAHINLGNIELANGVLIPLPLNLLPLPTRWKIIFLPPVHLPYTTSAGHDHELVADIVQDLRERMQKRLSEEAGRRRILPRWLPGRSGGR